MNENDIYKVRTTNRETPEERYICAPSAQEAAEMADIRGWVKVVTGDTGIVHEFLVIRNMPVGNIAVPKGDASIKHFQGPAYGPKSGE
jgi:hypothetical protein